MSGRIFKYKERLRKFFERSSNSAGMVRSTSAQSPGFVAIHQKKNAGDIPVVIPTFNSVTYCKNMVRQLRDRDVSAIILIDNGSTFKPMLKYLAAPPKGVQVILNKENLGPFYAILDPLPLALLPDYFCLTDPDLEFGPNMPNSFLIDLAEITDQYKIGKAGLALDLSDRAKMQKRSFPMATGLFTIWEWETQFWKKPVGKTASGDQIYKAPIDTTLAVYNKKFYRPKKYWDAVRVAGRYTCRHLPWYEDNGLPKLEEEHYKAFATRSYYLSDRAPIPNSSISPQKS